MRVLDYMVVIVGLYSGEYWIIWWGILDYIVGCWAWRGVLDYKVL